MQNLKYALNLIEKLHKICIILMLHRHVYSNTYCMEIYYKYPAHISSVRLVVY